MKTYYRSLIFGLLAIIAMPAIAQEDDYFEFFGEDREMDNLPTSILLEDRVPIKYNNPRADDIIWQKVVYRVIDLREKINYPLYFPEEAGDNRQSLFTTIFRLFEEGKIKCYNYLDNSKMFTATVPNKEDRSRMNICFVMRDAYKDKEEEFLKFATGKGMVGIKGHRLVGGFRASCYNALPIESVQALIDCMAEFEKQNA